MAYYELYRRLTAGQIEPAQFSHQDHIRAAWECLQKPLPEEINRLAAALQSLATRAGSPGRYHATITGAFLTLIAVRSRTGESFAQFQRDNTDLFNGDCLAIHYSPSRLELRVAREWFLAPDLKPLPYCPVCLTGVERSQH